MMSFRYKIFNNYCQSDDTIYSKINNHKIEGESELKLEMCQCDTDAPAHRAII